MSNCFLTLDSESVQNMERLGTLLMKMGIVRWMSAYHMDSDLPLLNFTICVEVIPYDEPRVMHTYERTYLETDEGDEWIA